MLLSFLPLPSFYPNSTFNRYLLKARDALVVDNATLNIKMIFGYEKIPYALEEDK